MDKICMEIDTALGGYLCNSHVGGTYNWILKCVFKSTYKQCEN